jgi:hypothetical protein
MRVSDLRLASKHRAVAAAVAEEMELAIKFTWFARDFWRRRATSSRIALSCSTSCGAVLKQARVADGCLIPLIVLVLRRKLR